MDEYDHPLIMEYLYAALLLHKLKRDITEDSVKNVLKATGSTPDEVRVKALIAALSEVNIDEALKAAPIGITPSSTPSAGTTSAPHRRRPPATGRHAGHPHAAPLGGASFFHLESSSWILHS